METEKKRARLSDNGSDREKASPKKEHRIIWLDSEWTGLGEPGVEHLLEVACLITEGDANLTIVAEAPTLIIHQPDSILDKMDDWNQQHHGESGLTQSVRDSTLTYEEADRQLTDFLREHTPPNVCPLAGNSIPGDRRFVEKFLPRFAQHLHYRMIDVSSLKELCRRWYPNEFEGAPAKKMSHRALDDIKESIAELRYYKKSIFNNDDH